MGKLLILAPTAWLILTAAINLPLPGAIFAPAEGYGWPVLIGLAGIGLVLAMTADLLLGTGLSALASALMAALLLAMALRLWLLPIRDGASPLALVGVREILVLFAACYAAFAAWHFRRGSAA